MADGTTVELTLYQPEGLSFDVDFTTGQRIITDGAKQFGGQNLGPQPMHLLLSGLGGCTAMDVISILRKMRQPVEAYRVEVHASSAEEHPKVFTDITIKHIVTGEVEEERLAHAIELSADKYCPAIAMLGEVAKITNEYEIHRS